MVGPDVVTLLITSVSLYIAGWYMKKNPPKKINAIYGYKTAGSMKSKERWDFAQIYAAEKLMFWSIAMGIMAIPMHFSTWGEETDMWVAIGLALLCAIIPIFQTESAINEKFGDN